MKRREFTREHKSAMLRRAMKGTNTVWCEGCGMDLTGKKIEFDHTIAEALIIDKSRKLTCDDGKLLGECCHRGEDGKTTKDQGIIAVAKRREATRFENHGQSRLQSRGFTKSPPQKNRASAPVNKTFWPARSDSK